MGCVPYFIFTSPSNDDEIVKELQQIAVALLLFNEEN